MTMDGSIFETPANSDAEEDAAAGPPPKSAQRVRMAEDPFKYDDTTDADLAEFAQPRGRMGPAARRRASTLFPDEAEDAGVDVVGAWRMTEVTDGPELEGYRNRTRSSSWLLVGRRHSVDERREEVEAGKHAFLRFLAAEASALRHQRFETQAAELAELDKSLREEMARQADVLAASKEFWVGSFAAGRSYLTNLERLADSSSAASLPHEIGQAAAEQIAQARKVASRAEAWALWMPHVGECYAPAVEEVGRTLERAMQNVEAATSMAEKRHFSLWPCSTEVPVGACKLTVPNRHSADAGPEGGCLWLAACQFLAATEALEASHQVALAQLRRQDKKLKALALWLDEALNCDSLEDRGSPTNLASLPSQQPSSPVVRPSDEPLLESVDLAVLVVHEVEAEVCYDYPRDTTDDSTWVPVRLLLSVDLCLHVWQQPGMDYHTTVEPSDSIDLLRECHRPVAVRSSKDPRVVQIAVRPDDAKFSLMQGLDRFLRKGATQRPPRRGLQFRCVDAADAADLLGAFDMIEALYPSADSP